MANREQVNKATDQKIFRETANKTKKVNIKPKVLRGGTRF